MQEQPFHESNLDSAEYRGRLMRKLNTLIAVLEVANAKVRRSLTGPDPDVEKLTRIKTNLQNTLEVCLRAKAALEKRGRLPKGLSKELSNAVSPDMLDAARMAAPRDDDVRRGRNASANAGSGVEMSSLEEVEKFRHLGNIDPAMVSSCDLDDLARKLQG